jgi:S-adenosylmethionine:tRNA ribosyltransferase-isomerase
MAAIDFSLPKNLEAHEPPEYRGVRRDHMRLLVLSRTQGGPIHTRFDQLGDFLKPDDLLVVNTSRTLPALLKARDDAGRLLEVRLARKLDEELWSALILQSRLQAGQTGMRLDFGEGFGAVVMGPDEELPFLWKVHFDRCCSALLDQIYRQGLPIHYDYVPEGLPLDLYQTIYAGEPGSVEMPSAGRAFSWELLFHLRRKGIGLAALTLHTGISSTRDDALDASHPIYPEEIELPLETARAINRAHENGGKVVAVGTTVVRALETAAGPDGRLASFHGLTRLHIDEAHRLRGVDALLTGLHEPRASHLDLLSAFVQPARLEQAYKEAIERGYLWHEFGDMNLIY